ncbi:MAG: immunity 8 family protein, partial [Myxococcota bacterium]|nr:immunity 8 family protein [Myxococcota bacterium]
RGPCGAQAQTEHFVELQTRILPTKCLDRRGTLQSARSPRTFVNRIVCDDGASLRKYWPADPASAAATVRLEISVGEERHWYSTTISTIEALASFIDGGIIERRLVVTSEWDTQGIWDFLVKTVRACDVGSRSDVRDLLRVRFDECAPLG